MWRLGGVDGRERGWRNLCTEVAEKLQLLLNFIVGGEVDYQKLYLGLSWVYVVFCIAEQRDGLTCGVQKMFSLWT